MQTLDGAGAAQWAVQILDGAASSSEGRAGQAEREEQVRRKEREQAEQCGARGASRWSGPVEWCEAGLERSSAVDGAAQGRASKEPGSGAGDDESRNSPGWSGATERRSVYFGADVVQGKVGPPEWSRSGWNFQTSGRRRR
ncbi:hypothetical protein U1Q18_010088 [Sarracenia purpurea var. burkii]